MISWGASAGFHDAALSVIKDGVVIFASHSERYSRIKSQNKSKNVVIGFGITEKTIKSLKK